jgi:hypothetical protein
LPGAPIFQQEKAMIAKLVTNSHKRNFTPPTSLEVVSIDGTTKWLNIVKIEFVASREGLTARVTSQQSTILKKLQPSAPNFEAITIGNITFQVTEWIVLELDTIRQKEA